MGADEDPRARGGGGRSLARRGEQQPTAGAEEEPLALPWGSDALTLGERLAVIVVSATPRHATPPHFQNDLDPIIGPMPPYPCLAGG